MDLTSHGTDDQLELYARGRLPESEVVALEEHLLVCPGCVARLEEAEQWTVAVREALKQDAAPAAKPGMNWLPWPKLAWVGMAFAVLVLSVAMAWVLGNSGANLPPVAFVHLAAMRGDMPEVEPAIQTDLTLVDAPGSGELRVQVVDSAGKSLWDEKVTGAGIGTQVKIRKELKPGTYFVRLYGPAALIHEYGFVVRAKRPGD